MSLDVSLSMPGASVDGSGIFIRESGSIREITRAEWNERFPNTEPVIAEYDDDSGEVYSANITHNLGRMADEAGVYMAMWRPEECEVTYAHQLIEPLRSGLDQLRQRPEYFKQFNPENGWGDYDGLVKFTERYLTACENYPQAKVSVSR